MANGNSLAPTKPKFSAVIQSEGYKRLINNTLGDPDRAQRFIASISSAVATNPALQECDAGTILSGALLGESLNLSPSPQLGQYYLVPFKKKDKMGNVISTSATFVMGYRGMIQLALRSGQYKKLNVVSIKEGEMVKFDPLNEEIEVNLIEDEDIREKTPTIGYYAMFEYINGFRKCIYWSHEKMLNHADRYSQAFNKNDYKRYIEGKIPEKDMWRYSSYWYKDFEGMAYKTLLRQLISKWGIMSLDIVSAVENDGAIRSFKDGIAEAQEYVEMSDSIPAATEQKAEEPKPESKKRTKKPAEAVEVEVIEPEQADFFDDADPLG